MYSKLLTVVGGLASSVLFLSSASAATLSIGLQETGFNSGNITTEATSGTGAAGFTGGYGAFSNTSTNAVGVPSLTAPDILDGDSIDVRSGGTTSATLNIYITEQGITSPSGLVDFTSSFTTNALSKNWTVTETTYYDPGNGKYALTDLLGSAGFATIATSGPVTTTVNTNTPYSVTELFTITAPGKGNANSTIDLSASAVTPLPAALPLFAGGLLGLGGFLKRRKTRNATA